MTNKYSPAYRALGALMDIARGSHRANNAWMYALTWLAASRIAASGQFPATSDISSLISASAWDALPEALIPAEARELVWGAGRDTSLDSSMRTQALGVVAKLIEEHGQQDWDVIDAPWLQSDAWRSDSGADAALAPELCELAFDSLQASPGSAIWIPFDPSGQLVMRAIRKRLHVIAAGPGRRTETHLRLLLAIEGCGSGLESPVEFEVPRGPLKRELVADFLLATPPFGMKLQPGTGWRQWESDERDSATPTGLYQRHGPLSQVQIDRSDSWAIAALWPRVRRRAVFLASSGVLFSKGQEQRLREYLVLENRSLAAVTLLPTRLLNLTTLASAMLVLDRDWQQRPLRLVDATEMTVETKSSMRYARVLDYERVVPLMTGLTEDEKNACNVSVDEILKQDFNLMPARYLRPVLTATGGPRRPLGDLVTVIRAPVASKEATAMVVQEAGFPELDRWREVTGPCSKTTSLQPRKLENHALRRGDLLVSIKGTLGKSALIGDVPTCANVSYTIARADVDLVSSDTQDMPVVPSQSCIALRVRDGLVSPILLFLYLRSDDFKRQIESLRSGAAIAHVTPATLLQDIQVPIVSGELQSDYISRWSELCELETSIVEAQERLNQIRAGLWPGH